MVAPVGSNNSSFSEQFGSGLPEGSGLPDRPDIPNEIPGIPGIPDMPKPSDRKEPENPYTPDLPGGFPAPPNPYETTAAATGPVNFEIETPDEGGAIFRANFKLENFLDLRFDDVKKAFGEFAGGYVEKFQAGWNKFTEIAGKGWDAATGFADDVADTVSDAWNGFTDTVSDAWDGVSGAVSDAWDSITDTVSGAWDSIFGGDEKPADKPVNRHEGGENNSRDDRTPAEGGTNASHSDRNSQEDGGALL